MSKPPEANRAA